MGLEFKTFLTEGISQLSYLVGDSGSGTAAVVDPRPDVDIYLDVARSSKLSITHVLETHIHADFMSGSRELAARLGTARIHCSHEGGAGQEYGFEHESVRDGEQLRFGGVTLTARHTPGHTPEHVAYELAHSDQLEAPWGVLTGDSLFVGSAGRPDLLGEEQSEELVEQLFQTLREYYLRLDDGVIIYPCHGHGSECGPNIGDRLSSSIGYERRHNQYLRIDDSKQFKESILSAAPPEPTHYPRMKKVNAAGPPILGAGPHVPAMPPQRFKESCRRQDVTLVDTRHMLAFGGGHIPGATNIGNQPELSVWAGWMVDPDKEILLVVDKDTDLPGVLPFFVRTGFTRFAGYLAGGMTAWDNAGLELQRLPQMSVHEVKERLDGAQLLDVRTPEEWAQGHLPKARHRFAPELLDHLDDLDRDRPVITYCNSGYRANLAASLLQARGFDDVRNVPGSWQAWTQAGYPTTRD